MEGPSLLQIWYVESLLLQQLKMRLSTIGSHHNSIVTTILHCNNILTGAHFSPLSPASKTGDSRLLPSPTLPLTILSSFRSVTLTQW